MYVCMSNSKRLEEKTSDSHKSMCGSLKENYIDMFLQVMLNNGVK